MIAPLYIHVVNYIRRVARLGGMAPTGLLLTAVGAIKFGFGALLDTFWATFRITGDRFVNGN